MVVIKAPATVILSLPSPPSTETLVKVVLMFASLFVTLMVSLPRPPMAVTVVFP